MVGKSGHKLKASAVDADAPVPDASTSRRVATPHGEARFDGGYAIRSGPFGPIRSYADHNRIIHTEFLKITMPQLALALPILDRPVIDRTNLTGHYHFSWERRAGPGEPMVDAGTLAQEALDRVGLKLEPSRAVIEVIVIDSIEKSRSAN